MINYKRLAKEYEKNAAIALQQFVRIDSVYDEATVGEGKPYGQGVKNALDYVAKLGHDYGFEVDMCDGRAVELTYGTEGPLISIYAHADVVPVSGDWDFPPFSGQLHEGKIIGRGAIDDKGPLIASLFALKLLKDNDQIDGYRVRLVAGGDEERGSSGLMYYFDELKKEQADYGFTPDAEWPLIYGEKAISRYNLEGVKEDLPFIAADGGAVANAVCDRLLVTAKHDQEFIDYLHINDIKFDVTSENGIDFIVFKGKSAHGSTPEEGVNAAAIAFNAFGQFYDNKWLIRMSEIIASGNGTAWGGFQDSEELKETTYNYGIIKYDGRKFSISLDFRYGEQANEELLIAKLGSITGLEPVLVSRTPALLFDKKSELVSTLMRVYKFETNDLRAKPFTIGGGTYAKEAANTVAFGATWENHPGNMHSPNEYIYIEDFNKCIAIYAHAINALGTIKK